MDLAGGDCGRRDGRKVSLLSSLSLIVTTMVETGDGVDIAIDASCVAMTMDGL